MTLGTSNRGTVVFDKDEMLPRVHNERARILFEEAVVSFNVGAYRASVVMMSCAVFEDLRLKAANHAHFDETAKILSEKLDGARQQQRSYENSVLDLTDKYNPLKNGDRRYLKQLLEARNQAAHGSGADIDEDEAYRIIKTGFTALLSVKFPWGPHGFQELISLMSNVDMFPSALPYDHEYTTRREIELRHPDLHWKMFDAIAEGFGTISLRFDQNAKIFLYWSASFQDPAIRKHLSSALIERRTMPRDSTWLIDILAADPALLGVHSLDNVGAADASIAAVIQEVSSVDDDRIESLEAVLGWLLTAVDCQSGRLRLSMEATLRKLVLRPSFHAALSTKYTHRAVAQHVLISSTFDHDMAEALVAAAFTQWEEGQETFFGRMLDGSVAFGLVVNLCRAGAEGRIRCARLADNGFASLPSIRDKAIEFLTSDPGKADVMLEDYEWFGYSSDAFFERFLKLSPTYRLPEPSQEDDYEHGEPRRPARPFALRKRMISVP